MLALKYIVYAGLLLFPLQLLLFNSQTELVFTIFALGAVAVMYYFTQIRPLVGIVALAVAVYGVGISMNAKDWLVPAMPAMVIGWVGAIIVLLMHSVSLDAIKTYTKTLIATDRAYLGLIGAITLFGFCLRWYQFTETPVLTSDEASAAIFGLTYFDGTFNNPFISGWLELPSMTYLLQGVTVKVFGYNAFALRISSVIIGTAFIPLVMWASRPLVARPFTLIAGLVVATCGLMLNFSRIGIIIINDSFYAVLLLGIMLRSAKIVTTQTSVLLGVVTGVAQFGYASARGFAVLLIVWYGLGIIHAPKGWWNALTQLVICGCVALAVAAPLMSHYYMKPDNFRAPLQRASLILPDSADGSSVLSRQSLEFKKSPSEILMNNFKKSFMAFITGPVDGWYRSNSSILPVGYAVLFVIGLCTSLITWRSQSLQITLIIITLACVAASLSYPVAAGHRMLNAMGAVAIVIAVGAQALYQLIVARVAVLKWVIVGMLTLALGQSALYAPYLYFTQFVTIEDGIGDYSMQIASQFGKYAQTLPVGTKVDVYETGYFSRQTTPIIDFLTKKTDYLAITGDVQPRADVQIMVIPIELVPTISIPATFTQTTIKAINGTDLLVLGIAPSFLP